MKLQDVHSVREYFSEIKRQRTSGIYGSPSFTIDQPHSCNYCRKIVLDIEFCRREWQAAIDADNVALMSGALDQTSFNPAAIHLHDTIQDAIDGAKDGCAFFQFLLVSLIAGNENEDHFRGASSHDIVFTLQARASPSKTDYSFSVEVYFLGEVGQVVGAWQYCYLSVWTDEGTGHHYANNMPFSPELP